ncbi:unnamed protein product [Prunus armeniaca]
MPKLVRLNLGETIAKKGMEISLRWMAGAVWRDKSREMRAIWLAAMELSSARRERRGRSLVFLQGFRARFRVTLNDE